MIKRQIQARRVMDDQDLYDDCLNSIVMNMDDDTADEAMGEREIGAA